MWTHEALILGPHFPRFKHPHPIAQPIVLSHLQLCLRVGGSSHTCMDTQSTYLTSVLTTPGKSYTWAAAWAQVCASWRYGFSIDGQTVEKVYAVFGGRLREEDFWIQCRRKMVLSFRAGVQGLGRLPLAYNLLALRRGYWSDHSIPFA